MAKGRAQHERTAQYAGLPFGAGEVEDVLRGVVVAVEAQIDVVGGGLLQSYVDGSVAYEGLIQNM